MSEDKKEGEEKGVEEEKEEKPILPKNNSKNQTKQLKWVVGIMAIVIIGLFLSIWLMGESQTFEYKGFNFQKVMFGKIPLYKFHVSGQGIPGSVVNMNVNLRTDPRTLENIDVPMVTIDRNPVYISIDPNIETCEYSSVALMNLGILFGGTGFEVKTGVSDLNYAEENNITYVSCYNIDDRQIVLISPGDETKIEQVEEDCYQITYKDCEILEATERFQLAVLLGFRGQSL